MKLLSQMLLLLFPIPCPAALGYQLDLLMGQPVEGRHAPQAKWRLPYGSFRVNSLIPAFEQIEEELKNLNTSDHWTIFMIIVLSFWIALGNLLMIWKLRRLEKKQSGIKNGKPV